MMHFIRLWRCLFFLLTMTTTGITLAVDVDLAASSQEIAVYEKVFKQQCHTFKYLYHKNPSGIIGFSATPGMGKTRLAKHLENRLQAIRINSDEIRNLLRHHHVNPDKCDPATGLREIDCYLHYCLARLEALYPNKLYILDMSLDRTFDKVNEMAMQNHMKIFVIRLVVNRPIVESRLHKREVTEDASYLMSLGSWFKDYEAFGRRFVSDYVFDNNEEGAAENISDLVRSIEQRFFSFSKSS